MLAGLSKAPQYINRSSGTSLMNGGGCIVGSDVDSVVLPIDACGGEAALAFARRSPNEVKPSHHKSYIIFVSLIRI